MSNSDDSFEAVIFILAIFLAGNCTGHACTEEAEFECKESGYYEISVDPPEFDDSVILETNIPCRIKEKEKAKAKQVKAKKNNEFGTEFD